MSSNKISIVYYCLWRTKDKDLAFLLKNNKVLLFKYLFLKRYNIYGENVLWIVTQSETIIKESNKRLECAKI